MNKSDGMFHCDTCGDIDHVLMDGYDIGDRLLEGVKFEIRREGEGFSATTHADSEEYMRGLNEKFWLKEMRRYASETDMASCPKCDADVDWPQEGGE